MPTRNSLTQIGKYIIPPILGLTVIALIVSLWWPVTQSFKVVFGSAFLLFLPGVVLSFAFFKKDPIDLIERLTLSFVLSITTLPLLVFYLNLLGLKISALSTTLVAALIIVVGFVVIWWRQKYNR